MTVTATYDSTTRTAQVPATWDELIPFIRKSSTLRRAITASILSMNDDMLRTAVTLHFVAKTGWLRHVATHYIAHISANLEIRFDNLIPAHIVQGFRFFNRKYTFVKPTMEDASIREFIFADEYLQAYINGDPDAIYYLTALLCRIDTSSRIRKRSQLDADAAFFRRYTGSLLFGSKITTVMANAMLLILQTKQHIKATYYPILGGSSEHQPNDIDFGFHTIVMDIAENGAYGDIEQVYDTGLHDIFVFLIKKKQDHDRINHNTTPP